MRDVDDRVSLILEAAEQREEALDVRAAEAARRLVEHQDAAADRQRARDLDELLLRDGQIADDRVGRDVVVPELRQRRAGPRAHGVPVDETRDPGPETSPARLRPKQQILHDAEIRRERQLLVDHRDARAPRVDRTRRRIRASVDRHRPGVGLERAREHRHQRALARAVLPDEPADLPGGHRQLDPLERLRGAECLPDPPHFKMHAPVADSCS
jgi:hypothetical protein